jgi:hypothetical protein
MPQSIFPTAAYQSAVILHRLAGANLRQSHRQLAQARELLAQSLERLHRIKRLLGVEH